MMRFILRRLLWALHFSAKLFSSVLSGLGRGVRVFDDNWSGVEPANVSMGEFGGSASGSGSCSLLEWSLTPLHKTRSSFGSNGDGASLTFSETVVIIVVVLVSLNTRGGGGGGGDAGGGGGGGSLGISVTGDGDFLL